MFKCCCLPFLPGNADEFTWDARPNKHQIQWGRDLEGLGPTDKVLGIRY